MCEQSGVKHYAEKMSSLSEDLRIVEIDRNAGVAGATVEELECYLGSVIEDAEEKEADDVAVSAFNDDLTTCTLDEGKAIFKEVP